MKRCILVSVRPQKDKETNDDLLFLTLYRLPNKMKNGGLWHPKKDEQVVNACINGKHKPEEYKKFLSIFPGALIDVTFALNEFTNKTYVERCDLVDGTNVFDETLLYL